MKRVKWLLGILLIGILPFVCSCAEKSVYSDVYIPIETFLEHPHVDMMMSTVLGGELTVTLGSNPTLGYQWQEYVEIGDASMFKRVSHEFVAPKTDMLGTPNKEVWTFKALKRGTTTILLKYSRSWDGIGLWIVIITATVK